MAIGQDGCCSQEGAMCGRFQASSPPAELTRWLKTAGPMPNMRQVWDGVVLAFDVADNPNATRDYAWSSPLEGRQ